MVKETPRNALQSGYALQWYTIKGMLGQGGFGITYLAHDTNLDRNVAIKEYFPLELAVREEDSSVQSVSENRDKQYSLGLERFIAEARTLAKFEHSNIVRVLSVFEENHTGYMVMAYELGSSLRQVLAERKNLGESELRSIFIPLLGGLAQVHKAGFIHRDIKPDNILVRKEGTPVLLDFGSARYALSQATHTLTNFVSAGYSPYEQYYSRGDEQGPWTDIYAMGATLYHCVVGRPPIDAIERGKGILGSPKDILESAVAAGRGRYSEEFLRAIDYALKFDAKDRPQNIEQWLLEFGSTMERALPVSEVKPRVLRRINNPWALAGASALLVIGLGVLFQQATIRTDTVPQAELSKKSVALLDKRPSIAILPFSNISGDPTHAYFSDGIHDDILVQLAKMSGLKVISRPSVMAYRDTTKNLTTIAEELRVETILVGSVQRAADRIRINVQLIDAETDGHLWAETYDQNLSPANIFAIQTEIATAVAAALQSALSPEDERRLRSVRTENLIGYEAYLLGRQRMAQSTTKSLKEAVEYFQKAIALDPGFALAYVGLADSYILQVSIQGLTPDENYAKAEAAIEKALQLDGRSGEAHTSLGLLKFVKSDFHGAEVEYKLALALNPNYAMAHFRYGTLMAVQGRPEEAVAQYQRAVELDPLSTTINNNLGLYLETLGGFEEAMAQFEKVVAIEPSPPGDYSDKALAYWSAFGKLDEAAFWYRKGLSLNAADLNAVAQLGLLYLELGDEVEGACWINRSIELGPRKLWSNYAMALLHIYRHDAEKALPYVQEVLKNIPRWPPALAPHRIQYLRTDRYAEIRELYEDAYPELASRTDPTIDTRNFGIAIDLAYVLQKTGEQQRAGVLLDRTHDLIAVMERLGVLGYWIADVQIYSLRGQIQQALSALRQAIDEGWRIASWYYLDHDPILATLHDAPEFQALAAELRADMASQLARIRRMKDESATCVSPG